MTTPTTTHWTEAHPAPLETGRWTTREIVYAALIGVTFGVVFQLWNIAWGAFAFLGTAQNLLYAVWLIPAVLAPLVVRKPGAAVFAEMVAAGVSLLLGSPYGIDTLLSGFVQGAAAELVFALTLYRNYSLPVLAAAAVASAVGAWAHDWALYNTGLSLPAVAVIGAFMVISALIIVPALSIAIHRSLGRAGVLPGSTA